MNKAPLAMLDNNSAWNLLPPAVCGSGQPLPIWGRLLSGALPRTTAALLQLDYLHRVASPLDPQLRSKLRYEVATVNRVPYSQAVALADLRRAGLPQVEIDAWRHDELRSRFEERLLLGFARSFSVGTDTIREDDLAGVISRHGVQSMVSIVLLLAFANLQDRAFSLLKTELETVPPALPVDVQFEIMSSPPALAPEWGRICETATAERKSSTLGLPLGPLGDSEGPGEVTALRHDPGPSALPDEWDQSDASRGAAPLSIVSHLVGLGHQSQCAQVWNNCIRHLADEAHHHPSFASLLDWIDTEQLGTFPLRVDAGGQVLDS